MNTDDEVYLLVPPEGRHLRAIRLVTADAGARAGLDSSQIDDLKIAVDELCSAVMQAAEERILVRILVHARHVIVWGSVADRDGAGSPTLQDAAELIIDAATDYYSLEHDGSKLSFVASKRAAGVGAP